MLLAEDVEQRGGARDGGGGVGDRGVAHRGEAAGDAVGDVGVDAGRARRPGGRCRGRCATAWPAPGPRWQSRTASAWRGRRDSLAQIQITLIPASRTPARAAGTRAEASGSMSPSRTTNSHGHRRSLGSVRARAARARPPPAARRAGCGRPRWWCVRWGPGSGVVAERAWGSHFSQSVKRPVGPTAAAIDQVLGAVQARRLERDRRRHVVDVGRVRRGRRARRPRRGRP